MVETRPDRAHVLFQELRSEYQVTPSIKIIAISYCLSQPLSHLAGLTSRLAAPRHYLTSRTLPLINNSHTILRYMIVILSNKAAVAKPRKPLPTL
ncbi:hypothetical protein E2C01_024078 [Portunus trituberculatus]|uniref:Uncharacterized protein n=1 Tax=Portunus trituberculatus TaxID=210409 RepID=A0A5B7E9G1_PORTR|nr:hypothetical protein [Portunus trituberculatus]